MAILVSGGAGYIGSHTCVELIKQGYEVIVADNLSNSCIEVIERIEKITGKNVRFINMDFCDYAACEKLFAENGDIDAVIAFAGLKAVGESVEKPLEYYDNNLVCVLNLLKCMVKFKVKNIVFSSSATVYGDPKSVPVTEEFELGFKNPYGATKLFSESIFKDVSRQYPDMGIALLRYFNPIGAHESGEIGEDPNGIPNNLVPYIAKVAIGELSHVNVFGDDYDTVDGTGVRDYIHVMDLATGHIKMLEKLSNDKGLFVYNLGTGKGYSVLEVIKAYERACGKELKYEICARRAGDSAISYANATKAKLELGWVAKYDIDDMCKSSWNWQKKNPKGYRRGE